MLSGKRRIHCEALLFLIKSSSADLLTSHMSGKMKTKVEYFFHIRVEFEWQLPAASAFHQWEIVVSIANGFEGQEEELLPRQWLDKRGLSLDQEANLRKCFRETVLVHLKIKKNGWMGEHNQACNILLISLLQ